MELRKALEYGAPASLDDVLHEIYPHSAERAIFGHPLELCLVVPAERDVADVRLAVPTVFQKLVTLSEGEQSK